MRPQSKVVPVALRKLTGNLATREANVPQVRPSISRARGALGDPDLEPLDKLVFADRRGRPRLAILPDTRIE